MLFPTTVFAIYFLCVFAGHWTLLGRPRARKVWLLAASLVFYGYWRWEFALMLLASACLNHRLAVAIDAARDGHARRRVMVAAAVFNLGLLAFFKYTGFLLKQVFTPLAVPLCRWAGATDHLIAFQESVLPFVDRIILPVGISFYTFQALSYVVDVYWRKTAVARSTLDFANYLAFFPQLVAGPIVRASDLLPQMAAFPGRGTRIDTGRAAILIMGGLFKKMVIANWLAEHLADPVFAQPEAYASGADLLLGVYAYAVQIYCDFSAYSDIAIGCALLMGFHFPVNFNAPYFSRTLQEFWRGWHISLSSWLRDYLYIPLGGSRTGAARTRVNLLLTFLLGGLWHGAAWTFVLWGAFHGLYLSLERIVRRGIGLPEKPSPAAFGLRALPGQVWTFHVVCFSWLLFRATDLSACGEMLRGLCRWEGAATLWTPRALVVLGVGFALQALDGDRARGVWRRFNALPVFWQGAIAALTLTIILALSPEGVAPFIYFQF